MSLFTTLMASRLWGFVCCVFDRMLNAANVSAGTITIGRSNINRFIAVSFGLVLVAAQMGDAVAQSGTTEIKICPYDTGSEDGDRIDVEFDGETIFSNLTLDNDEQCKEVSKQPGRYLLLVRSLDTGSVGPNTAAVVIRDSAGQEKAWASWDLGEGDEERWDVDVSDDNITITPDLMPSFGTETVAAQTWTQNTAIDTLTLPAASGGDAPLAYSLAPNPPAGVVFDAVARTLSGTPSEAQAATVYTYRAIDGDGDEIPLTFTITITPDLMPSFDTETVVAQTWTQNLAIATLTLPAATGGDAPLTYSLDPALPAGLVLNTASRTISGTPTTPAATATYTWTATDSDATDPDSATLTFTITVAADLAPSFGDATIADQGFTQNLAIATLALPAASGGDGAPTYNLDPALPVGLALDTASRQISGTPTTPQEATPYAWTVRDEDGDEATLNFTIAVAADLAPAFDTTFDITIAAQTWAQNTAIATLTLPAATGGDAPLTYSLDPDPPAGLEFDAASRTLSGTPTTPQVTTTYAWIVRDTDGDETRLNFTITVAADLAPSFGDTTIADQGFTQNLAIATLTLPAASGGDGALTYNLDPALPAGLELDTASRQISGTPTATQDALTYAWKATDADGDEDTLSFRITVAADTSKEKEVVEETVEAIVSSTLSNVTTNIGTRFSAARGGTAVTVAGLPVALEDSVSALAAFNDRSDPALHGEYGDDFRSQHLTLDRLLQTSAFQVSLAAADADSQGAGSGPSLTVWGRVDSMFFDKESDDPNRYDGKLNAGYLGIDTWLDDRWLLGVAASVTKVDAGYGLDSGGELDLSIVGVHPYVRLAIDDLSELWLILGLSRGKLQHLRTAGSTSADSTNSDVTMYMGAAGMRRELTTLGGIDIALLGDAGFGSLRGGVSDLPAIDNLSADAWRARLGFSGSHTIQLEGLATFTPFVEIVGRYDGGDDGNAGLEIAGGIQYANPASGLGLEIRANVLPLYSEDDYREYGFSISASASPGIGGEGLAMAVATSLGPQTGSTAALWRENLLGAANAADNLAESLTLDTEIGYGFPVVGSKSVLTPFGGLRLRNGGSQQMRAGVRLGQMVSARPWNLELSGEQRTSDVRESEYLVSLLGRLRF